ncbi:hypothetical protein KCU89_g20, partial [Aureobasidium melanogenum]
MVVQLELSKQLNKDSQSAMRSDSISWHVIGVLSLVERAFGGNHASFVDRNSLFFGSRFSETFGTACGILVTFQ